METEQAKHETEESLMLAQFGTNFSPKLQNGAQSSEEDSMQITEDTNWITHPAHYKPNKGVSSVKRYREDCNIRASEQRLCKMNGDLTNGELNHAHTEQSLLVHQPKKMKVDVENRENVDTSYNLENNFSESESSSQWTETSFDKRNCHIPNGDIFCLPRNKQVSNGAVSSSSTIEHTPGDLLEKTLSQYYPEQVSIAPQTSGAQLDTVNDSLTNQLSSEGAQPTALTSGFQTNSSHMTDSQQQQSGSATNAEGGNRYNSVNYSVNGYSHNFEVDRQHQQHHHLQQSQSYSGQELDLGPLPDMVPPLHNANRSQHPNGGPCFSNDTNPQGNYTGARQEFNPSSFVKHSKPLHTTETGGYGSFHNSGIQENKQSEKCVTGQTLQPYVNQTQNFQERVGKQHRPDGVGHMGPGLQHPHHIRMENGMENTQQRANISCSTPTQTGWIDDSPLQPHQPPTSGSSSHTQEQNIWRGFPGKPQPERQTESPQVCSQLLEPNSVQQYRGTQTQGVFTDSSQTPKGSQQKQQDCLPSQRQGASMQHNTAPEWQQLNLKTPHMQQTLLQKIPEQRNFPQNQQAENCYQSQREPEHFCENNELQDILSAGFVTTQQQEKDQQLCLQRPLSHPPQFEGQHLKSPNYRPHSQPPPGSQLQTDQPLRNNSAQPNNRDIHPIGQPTFTYNNTTEIQQPQPQKQYFTDSSSKNLNQFQPQQSNNHCHETNQVDFSQTFTQSQPHLPQGLVNQQVTTQMYLKSEQQMKASCTQFQMGPRLPLGPVGSLGDSQRQALRLHLLQKQDRHSSPHPLQGSSDPKQVPRAVKIENGPRFELPASRQEEQLQQMREPGMGGIHIKQENQQFMCVQNKKQGSILSSMEQSLRQYQFSPVSEKKSVVFNSFNKVKVESSGPVTILSTNTHINGLDSSAGTSSSLAQKKMLDSTPKKEQLLKSFIDSPIKLLDTPIKNLLDTPMKTQYEIPSCHCVGES